MNWKKLLPWFCLAALLSTGGGCKVLTSPPGEVIRVIHAGPDYAFAADELAYYIHLISGGRLLVAEDPGGTFIEGKSFVLGPPGSNPAVKAIDGSLGGEITDALTAGEAFAVWPVREGGKRAVVLAGKDPVTTLYAVYAYLEEFCHAGFFQDGERIPRMDPPFEGEPRIFRPRFRDRKGPFTLGAGHWGLKKFFPRFWTLEEIQYQLRWMAKRRLNLLSAAMTMEAGSTQPLVLALCEEMGHPIDPPGDEVVEIRGFPVSRSWPPSHRTGIMEEALAFGRKLGIRFVYALRAGEVPAAFKKKYPGFRYIETEWEHAQLHPDDPFYRTFTSRFVRKVNDRFGTDHLYFGTPFCETSPGSTPEESFDLKMKAASGFAELLRESDPEAVWVTDSWDFFWSRDTWTPERVKRYLDALPGDAFYMYDTNADNRGVPIHAQHGFFLGKDWAFGIMHSAAGHDQLHGDFEKVLSRLRRAATAPEAGRCRGVFLVPELTNYNIMYYDFLTRAAWDPRDLEPGAFLDGFVLRRYGHESAKAMRAAAGDVMDALYTREMNIPVYNLATLKWVFENQAPWIQRHTVPRLHRVVTRMLEEYARQQDNPLFENDLLNVAKAYLAELSAYHFHLANGAYAAGDKERFEGESERCLACVEGIAKILSTRPDYSLARMIEEVMKVPGTNRHTPWMILKGAVNWDYCSNDSYEQVANYALPRLHDYFQRLTDGFETDRPPVDLKAMLETLSPGHEDWMDAGRSLGRFVVHDGTTVEAIREAFVACTAGVPEAFIEGRPPARAPLPHWQEDFGAGGRFETGEPGGRIEGNLLSSDPAFAPMGSSMHREWVDMPVFGTVRTKASAGLGTVDLEKAPLLTLRYRIEQGDDPVHLWAVWRGRSGMMHRTRVWRSFAPAGKWAEDSLDLLHALRSRGEEPEALIALEFGLLEPPHAIRIACMEVSPRRQ